MGIEKILLILHLIFFNSKKYKKNFQKNTFLINIDKFLNSKINYKFNFKLKYIQYISFIGYEKSQFQINNPLKIKQIIRLNYALKSKINNTYYIFDNLLIYIKIKIAYYNCIFIILYYITYIIN
ncbi:hypothetical protein PPERSA_00684 [Pseudocohnilembus persalinus]|uniref:Uncharacterized protein n=1 Tax=Pseudocohnilembus persalinus TaxID=266149 RepID=A0A0V0QT36_PSEPJ|nr:hypothetical protein PPERSA_00684 [Pseudocohnilembus persalinus]|eukprot:KRX05383.1 hypothetical protein PPERSA_00684 [Pseudocohnilembus persalinus]